MFLRGVLPLCRLQHGQQLGGLGTVGWGIIPGHTGALNEERGAIQDRVCGRMVGSNDITSFNFCCDNGLPVVY